MEEQKQRVKRLESQVAQAKASYAEALRNLEQISDEIHKVSCYSCYIQFSPNLILTDFNGFVALLCVYNII